MNTYRVTYKYSKNGRAWTTGRYVIKAESDISAMMQVESKVTSKYPYMEIVSITQI